MSVEPGPAPAGGWHRFKTAIFRGEKEFAVLKGLTALSIFGTLVGAYIQNLSAYENKVAAQAQSDMTAATQAFADVSGELSLPLILQKQLILSYHHAITANTDTDATAYDTANARTIYKLYTDAYGSLSKDYNLLARKGELYIDWASDLTRYPDANGTPTSDNIDMSLLNTYGFDCENNMPSFQNSTVTLTNPKNNPPAITVDWYSAKHNVLAIETCFETTHEAMTPVLQWASGSAVDPAKKTDFINRTFAVFDLRRSNQVLRLNAFMSLAMFDIDKIRVKYQPNGFICSLPGISEALSLINRCTAIQTKSPLS
jgi:hypothetical protein